MTKTKIAIILLSCVCAATASLGLTACSNDTVAENVENGSSTTLVTNKAPDELTPENVVYAFLQKQSKFSSYKITSEGAAVANLAGYKQDIHNIIYKNGEDYLSQASSNSFLVKMKYQCFSKNGKVVYRDSFEGDMYVAEKAEYKKVYGFTADDITLGGYIINAKTLRYATLEKTEGDTFTYYMCLAGDQSVESGAAGESATTGVRLQSKAYGSLDNLPSYSDVDLRLTIKKDWTPVSYVSSCSYDAKKLFNMSVQQEIVSTYSDVNGNVDIPDVEAFNAKIGSEPSTIKPNAPSQDPLTQLATTFGNTLGDKNTLSMPVSLSLALSEKPLSVNGDLSMKLKKDTLESGELLDAFTLRLDLDLSPIPLISGIADTVTVRYVGDGMLLLMLNDRSQGADKILLTYPVDLGNTLASLSSGRTSGNPGQTLEEYVKIEASETGYTISLEQELIAKLNTYIGNFAQKAETALKDTGGYVRSLLDIKFTDITVNLEGKDKITKLALVLEGNPPENVVTQGEKIEVSLDVGQIKYWGLLQDPFMGPLQFRLNPTALLTGDYYAVIAEAHLNLNLLPAKAILTMAGTMAQEGALPDWVGPNLTNMDVYYTGDGMLTLSLNNAQSTPLFVTQIDLKEQSAFFDGALSSLLSKLKFGMTATGTLALDASSVTIINEAYQQLVPKLKKLVSSLGSVIEAFFGGYLDAQISGAEFFLGKNDEGKMLFDFTIKGIPKDETKEPVVISLLSLTLTLEGKLTKEELKSLANVKETVENLLAQFSESANAAKDRAE